MNWEYLIWGFTSWCVTMVPSLLSLLLYCIYFWLHLKIYLLNVFQATPNRFFNIRVHRREPIKSFGCKCTKKQAKYHQLSPYPQIFDHNFIIRAYVLQTTGALRKKRLCRMHPDSDNQTKEKDHNNTSINDSGENYENPLKKKKTFLQLHMHFWLFRKVRAIWDLESKPDVTYIKETLIP